MSRITIVSCLLAFFVSLSAPIFAQQALPEPRGPLAATPEVLALVEKVRTALDGLENTDDKASGLFQLLSFELRFTDKAPARQTLQAIQKQLEKVQKEPMRTQLLEAVAYSQAEIGDFESAVKTTQDIPDLTLRTETQLNVAEGIIRESEENAKKKDEKKDEKPAFDVVGLLRKVVAGAAEAKDAGLEALSTTILARELAKQGKLEEAKPLFQAARKKAREIEEIEERNVVALIVRSEVQYGMIPEALAMTETIQDEEIKQAVFSLVVVSIAQEGKVDEAEKLLVSMKAGDIKDSTVVGIAKEIAGNPKEAATEEKLTRLAGLMSSPERKEMFVQNIMQPLLENGRNDVAAKIAELSANPQEIRLTMTLRELESLIEAKKFPEAEKLIGTMDERLRPIASRHLILAEIQGGADPAAMKDRIEKTLSDEEKQQLVELKDVFEKAKTLGEFDERMAAYYEVMQAQVKLFDMEGARKTVARMLEDTTAPTVDAAKQVSNRLILSRIQTELNDKAAAKENLQQLLKYLAGVKDVMSLKELVPPEDSQLPEPEGEAVMPALKLKAPVDETAVKSQLFIVYVSAADALGRVDDIGDAKTAVDRAAALVDGMTDVKKKAEGYLLLSQVLAELDIAKQ